MKDWKKVKLGTLLTESKVESTSPNPDKRISVKLNVNGVEKRPLTKDKKGATKYFVRKAGQFIYGKQNLHKGAFGIVPEELDGYESSSDIPAFDVDESCYPEWIFYFFKKGNFYLKLESLAKGVGSKRIHPHQIFDLDIFLPEKEEQRDVLDRVIQIEKNVKLLGNSINNQFELLKKLEDKTLDEAVYGILTKEWRDKNHPSKTGAHLKVEIALEQEKWLKKSKEEGYKEAFTIEKKLKKLKKSEPIVTEVELPIGWKWIPLLQVSNIIVDCHNKTAPYVKDGIKLVRTTNIKNRALDVKDTKFVTEETYRFWSKRCIPEPGDILFTREAPVGEGAIIPPNEKICMGQRMMLIRVFENLVLPQYVLYTITAPDFLTRISKLKKGTMIGHLRVGDVEGFHVQIPSYSEQLEIVKRLDCFFRKTDLLKDQLMKSQDTVDILFSNFLLEILGEENKLTQSPTKENKTTNPSREIKYDSKTKLMALVELLKKHGRLHAEDLWKMSRYPDDIDKFYAELKKQIEEIKSIKESTEKGYLELA